MNFGSAKDSIPKNMFFLEVVMKKAWFRKEWRFLTGLSVVLLTISLILAGCGGLGEAEEQPNGPETGTAGSTAKPVLSDLLSSNYVQNATAVALQITARGENGGTLSYQWFSNTTIGTSGGIQIPDVAGNSYTPPTAEIGDTYYYVVVTNTDETKDPATATRTSNVARIRVTETEEVIGAPAATMAVNTDTKYQYIRGFGGMSSAWTSPPMNNSDVDQMFDPDKFGYNIFRIMIYPYMDDLFNGVEEAPDSNPAIHKSYYTMAKRAKSHGALLLASPWTPPAEYKMNNSRLSGLINPDFYANYARHLRDYIDRMTANGASIDYISTQNEPDIGVKYDGCEWTGIQMRDFIKQYGRFIAPANGPVKLIPGESYQFLDTYYNPIYNDPEAMASVDVIGGHVYGGGVRRHTKAIDAGKEVWMTEHLLNTGSNYDIDSQWQSVWVFIQEVHDLMGYDFNAFVWWYSKRFYSLIGDGEYGTIDGQPLARGYALSHYAKYATGKTRVATSISGGSIPVTAYESDSEITLVMFNRSANAVGQLNINLPVEVKGASMVITKGISNTSNELDKAMAPDIVLLSADKKTGILDLPASCIVSVRFTK
jgi:O-glycosyl hydrolase